jgi:hypothetical protein
MAPKVGEKGPAKKGPAKKAATTGDKKKKKATKAETYKIYIYSAQGVGAGGRGREGVEIFGGACGFLSPDRFVWFWSVACRKYLCVCI